MDPESKKLWDELKKYERKPCCRKLIDFIQETKCTQIKFYNLGYFLFQIEIIYCSECGEKLER